MAQSKRVKAIISFIEKLTVPPNLMLAIATYIKENILEKLNGA